MSSRTRISAIALVCAVSALSLTGGPASGSLGRPWPATPTMPSTPGDWPQYLYGASRGAFNPFETVLTPATVGGLEQKWAKTTGLSIFSSPVVASGTVFFASADEFVYAVDVVTGQQRWRFRPGGELQGGASPAVANGVVYQMADTGMEMFAVDARTGRLLWTAAVGDSVGSPALGGGSAFVTNLEGDIAALDVATGDILWSTPTGADLSTPTVSSTVVYVGTSDGTILGYDGDTGGLVYTSDAAGILSADAPVVYGSLVIATSLDSHVYAFDLETGEVVWTANTGDSIMGAPALAAGVVYVGSENGNVHALDAATGALRWRARVAGNIWSSPAVAGGVMYVTADDLNLYAFRAATGALLATRSIAGGPGNGYPPLSSPAVSNGMVFIGSTDANLYAFGL